MRLVYNYSDSTLDYVPLIINIGNLLSLLLLLLLLVSIHVFFFFVDVDARILPALIDVTLCNQQKTILPSAGLCNLNDLW